MITIRATIDFRALAKGINKKLVQVIAVINEVYGEVEIVDVYKQTITINMGIYRNKNKVFDEIKERFKCIQPIDRRNFCALEVL